MDGDRSNFENAGGTIRLFPDFAGQLPGAGAEWETNGCAPLTFPGRNRKLGLKFQAGSKLKVDRMNT
jgi:hypothetical protein